MDWMEWIKDKKTWIQIALVVLLAVMVLPNFIKTGITSSQSFKTVDKKMEEKVQADLYPKQDNQNIKRYLGLDPANYEGISFYRLDDAMSANEMVIVEFKDESQKEDLKKALEQRKDSQYNIFEGYAPEQAEVMKNAVVDVQNNYAFYYAGEDPAKMQSDFISVLEGGK